MRDAVEIAAGLGVKDWAPDGPFVGPTDGGETELGIVGTPGVEPPDDGETDGLEGLNDEGLGAGDCTLESTPVEPAEIDGVEGLSVDPGGRDAEEPGDCEEPGACKEVPACDEAAVCEEAGACENAAEVAAEDAAGVGFVDTMVGVVKAPLVDTTFGVVTACEGELACMGVVDGS